MVTPPPGPGELLQRPTFLPRGMNLDFVTATLSFVEQSHGQERRVNLKKCPDQIDEVDVMYV